MTPRLAALAAVLALAACGEAPPPTAPAAPAPPPPPPLTAAGPFKVSDAGIGVLTADTRFFIPDVQKAFPGSTAIETYIDGPEVIAALSVSGENGLKMDMMSAKGTNNVAAVYIYGGPVVGPGGGTIKGRIADAGVTADQCEKGAGRYAGKLVCTPAGAKNVNYIVRGSAAGGTIQEIFWSNGDPAAAVAGPKPIQLTVKRG
jgi:hypothetical protein